jgi:hypothetical protein
MMSLIADFLMVIVVSASILYAINKKPENKAISRYEDDVDNGDDGNNEIDSKKEEKEFISEWISVIKERIEYENRLSLEQRQEERNRGVNKISWNTISKTSNPIAIELLKEYHENICWINLCANEHPYAIELLKKYPEKIYWSALCLNKNPDVIPLLKERIELEKTLLTLTNHSQYTNTINWEHLFNNECMFELIMDRIEYEKHNNWIMASGGRNGITKIHDLSSQMINKILKKDRKSLIIFKSLCSVNNIRNLNWSDITDTIIQLSNLYYLREA